MWAHAACTCDGATKDGLVGTARREKADNTRRVVSGGFSKGFRTNSENTIAPNQDAT